MNREIHICSFDCL